MRYRLGFLRVAVLCAITVFAIESSAANSTAPAHRLRVALTADAIEVERATPGGTVLVIGYEHFVRDFEPVYRRVHRERVADGNGTAVIAIGRPIAPVSFWVAFDLDTGGHGAVGGTKRALREAELPEQAFTRESNGKKTKFTVRADYAYVLTIRPKAGVWDLTAGDGGQSDDDQSLDGKIETTFRRLGRTKHAREDLDGFEEGDVVAMFVPHQMGYLVTRVKK